MRFTLGFIILLFSTQAVAQVEQTITPQQRSEYNRCKAILSQDQRAEFFAQPIETKTDWLATYCRSTQALARLAKIDRDNMTAQMNMQLQAMQGPVFYDESENHAERYNWHGSRIFAHATFWLGLMFLAEGIAFGSILDWNTKKRIRSAWSVGLISGGVLTLAGSISGSVFLSKHDKRRKKKKIYSLTATSFQIVF